MKNIIVWTLVYIGVSLSLFADSSYDRTIEVVGNQTRDEKVTQVFKEMITLYQDEDAMGFLEHASEDRFLQDYLTFSDAIYQDTREYDILEINYWINEIVPKGTYKRYLNVRWERYSIHNESAGSYTKKGVSRFLFDDINGEYKLIELAGNNLWGDSLPEWTEEVPTIPGQEVEVTRQPDLSVAIRDVRHNGLEISVEIEIKNGGNIGSSAAFDWGVECNDGSSSSVTYQGYIEVGDSVTDNIKFRSDGQCNSLTVTVDSNEEVVETDETNNIDSTDKIQKIDIGVKVLSAKFANSKLTAEIELSNSKQASRNRDIALEQTIEWSAECDDGTHYTDEYDGLIDAGSSVKVEAAFDARSCDELTVVVDPNEKIDEADEENNEVTYAVDVEKLDLSVQITSAAEDSSGDVTVKFTILNRGEDDINSPFEWSVECDGAELSQDEYDSTIAAGRSVDISTTFDASNYNCDEVLVIIDSRDAIAETDEDNNEDYAKVSKSVVAKPDLTIEKTAYVDTSSVEVEISNIGTGASTQTFYWSVTCDATTAGDYYSGTIAANSSDTASVSITCTSGGDLIVDVNNDIDESNENNNENTF